MKIHQSETLTVLNYKTTIFKDSPLNYLVAQTYKHVKLAFEFKTNQENYPVVCILKEDLLKLADNIAQSVPGFDKETIEFIVEKILSRSNNTHKQSIEDVVNEIHRTVNTKFIDQLFNIPNNLKESKSFLLKKLQEERTEFNLTHSFTEYASQDQNIHAHADFLTNLHKYKILPTHINAFVSNVSNILYKKTASDINIKINGTENFIYRAPSEVIIDLLVYLRDQPDFNYTQIEQRAKSLFLTHQTTIASVKHFLRDIQENYSDSSLADKCRILEDQLMREPIYTRLNDNIYGRVFDSQFVVELVNSPPEEVQHAMTNMAQGLAVYLEEVQLSDRKKKNLPKNKKSFSY